MIGLSFKVGHLVLFLLFTIEVNASKEDLVTRNVGNVTKFRDVLFGIPGEQPTETQLLARRKRGSLDPIVGLKVRRKCNRSNNYNCQASERTRKVLIYLGS